MISLRPITEDDLPFLRRLYGSTRAEELEPVPWSEGEKRAFLDMQFQAQHDYYQAQYARAAFDVVERDGVPIGRLYVDRRAEEIRIVDIALLPEWRRQGIGSALLEGLCAESAERGLPLTIHVERFNPALGLYRQLGFRQIGDQGVYLLLRREGRSPEPAVAGRGGSDG